MNRLGIASLVALVISLHSGCINPDPPHYETPLPNGLYHFSNGGEQGWFGTPFAGNTSTRVYPTESKWHCNEFAVVDNDLIGLEIQYAKRAYDDPPAASRWFYFDTKSYKATTFDSLEALREHCESLGHPAMPDLVRSTSETQRMEFD